MQDTKQGGCFMGKKNLAKNVLAIAKEREEERLKAKDVFEEVTKEVKKRLKNGDFDSIKSDCTTLPEYTIIVRLKNEYPYDEDMERKVAKFFKELGFHGASFYKHNVTLVIKE